MGKNKKKVTHPKGGRTGKTCAQDYCCFTHHSGACHDCGFFFRGLKECRSYKWRLYGLSTVSVFLCGCQSMGSCDVTRL